MCQTLLASNNLMMMVMIMILHDTSVHDTTHQTDFRKVPALGTDTFCFAYDGHQDHMYHNDDNEMIIKQKSQW